VIPDRLVSLADLDARPIPKGKPQHPTQFGYSLLLAEEERGFMADHQLRQGNPPDARQLVPAVARVVAVTSRPPATVVAVRGFGTAANDQALDALGVTRIGLPRTGTRARRGWRWSEPGPSPVAQLAGRHRGPHQPPQARLRAAAHPAAAAGRRPYLGRPGDLRLQAAADDGGCRMTRTGGRPASTRTAAATPTKTSSGQVGLIQGLLADLRLEPLMADAVARARTAGIRVGVITNSWGTTPAIPTLPSARPAVRRGGHLKRGGPPQARPGHLLSSRPRVGRPSERIVFVDDTAANLQPAQELGMAVLHHVDPARTVEEL
jgi:hypothetical protein